MTYIQLLRELKENAIKMLKSSTNARNVAILTLFIGAAVAVITITTHSWLLVKQ